MISHTSNITASAKTTGRVVHEFKRGKAGSSKYQSKSENKKKLERSERKRVRT